MLDLKYIRENVDLVKKAIVQKKVNLNLDDLLAADQKVIELKKKLQALQEDKNATAKKVPKATPEERPSLIEHGKKIGQEISALEPQVNAEEEKLKELLWLTPLVPAADVPVGKDDSENVERRKHGTPPAFSFKAKTKSKTATPAAAAIATSSGCEER